VIGGNDLPRKVFLRASQSPHSLTSFSRGNNQQYRIGAEASVLFVVHSLFLLEAACAMNSVSDEVFPETMDENHVIEG